MGERVVEAGNVRRASSGSWVEVEGPRATAFLGAVAEGRATVTIDGVVHRGPVGWCPADRLVFPHLSVRENLGYAGVKRAEVERMAALLGLTERLERRPRALSAAEREATALGRAMLASRLWVLEHPGGDDALRAVIIAEQAVQGAFVLGCGLPARDDRWSV